MSNAEQIKIITPLVDKYLCLRQRDKRKDGWHCSQLSYCGRQIYYKMNDYPVEKYPTAVDHRKWATGHAVEGMYDEWFSGMVEMEKKKPGTFKNFKLIATNQHVEDKELDIVGEFDKIVEVSGVRYLVDIKSSKDGDYSWEKIPFPNNIIQVQIYMWLTGEKNGVLIYENKNTHEQAEFHFPYNQAIIDKIKNKLVYLKKCIKDKELPKREYQKSDINCRMFCDYSQECWG